MNNTASVYKNQPDIDLFGFTEWRTNSTTGDVYRLNDDDLVSAKKRRKLPARFKREHLWDWCQRQDDARQKLVMGRKGWRLLRHYRFKVYIYTLSVSELGGADWLEQPEHYDDEAAIEAWHRLLDKAFAGQPYLWALHVGRCGRVHAHVLAGAEHSVPALSNDPERRKRVQNTPDDYRRVVAYLTGKMYATPRQVKAYERAVQRAGGERYLPKHSGFRGFENVGRVQKAAKNSVLHGNSENYPYVVALKEHMPALTLDRFERVMFPGSGGAFSRSWTPTGPPQRGVL